MPCPVPFRTFLPALAGLALSLTAQTARAAPCIDLRLVLAIDSSGSIDAGEFQLQIDGYLRALSDPSVIRAIAAAGQVEIGVVFWADDQEPLAVVPPGRVDQGRGRAALAAALQASPRAIQGSTGIGRGLDAALTMLAAGGCADRLVVDVSGDGRESRVPRPVSFLPLWLARERAETLGVTVNGLSVGDEDPGIHDWYHHEVILGPDAFAVSVDDWEDFASAIRDKLIREIRPPQFAAAD